METTRRYLEENKKVIAIICKIDKNENEYNHRFYLCDKGEYDSVAWDLEIMKMEDVSLWESDIEEAIKLGFNGLEDCYNYKK